MARTVTREWIRDQARELADEPSVGPDGGFVTDDTINEWINQAYTKLVDLLVKANPDWYLHEWIFDTTAGNYEAPVPADFYQVRGIDRFEGLIGDPGDDQSSRLLDVEDKPFVPIDTFNFLERDRGVHDWPPARNDDPGIRYKVIRKGIAGGDTRIRFDADPGRRTWRLWYVLAAQTLDLDADSLDGVNGYEEFIVADVAEKMMIKAETDPSGAIRMKNEAVARIQAMAPKRNQDRPVKVADTRNRSRRLYP